MAAQDAAILVATYSVDTYNSDMDSITLDDLQHCPDSLLDRIQAGERLLVVRDGRPVAELRPIETVALPMQRPRGVCAGEFVVPDDFDAPLPDDILQDFEGR